jgi:L-fucose isomerase-like protein
MVKKTLTLGVAPVKRASRDMNFAKKQKDRTMSVIRQIRPDIVKIVDIDDLSENGIAFKNETVPSIVRKFKDAEIDALFIPFCDFGEESVAAAIAGSFRLPVLVWGNRDEFPNSKDARGPDTQCGMFAATKVMARRNVKYSYIHNVPCESEDFRNGYLNFIRFANVIKDLSNLNIAKINQRPITFWSVMTNEAELLTKLNIGVVPISSAKVMADAERLRQQKSEEYLAYIDSLKNRFDTSAMTEEKIQKTAALKIAIQKAIETTGASACTMECWSEFGAVYGIMPCVLLGDITDQGIPIACECDINGAISQAILYAANLYDTSVFLADLTIRNPENDQSELLWHCGPFPYSLKACDCEAELIDGQEQFRIMDGDLTLCRFDELNGKYSLFSGEGYSRAKTGPITTGTYTYLETDNWKRWEEKLIFGPYIHHVAGVYGKYLPVLREVARYLGIQFDSAHEQGVYSL